MAPVRFTWPSFRMEQPEKMEAHCDDGSNSFWLIMAAESWAETARQK